jgi:methylglyoxal synthase
MCVEGKSAFAFSPAPVNPIANSTTLSVFTAASGPVGAQTAIQGWIAINVAGTQRFIPYW